MSQQNAPFLSFTHNWNHKLDCTSFTTLRLENKNKYQIGKKFSILLKGKYLYDAEIVDLKSITIAQINEWIARLDTGYSREECVNIIQTMYKKSPINWEIQKLSWVLFRRLDCE